MRRDVPMHNPPGADFEHHEDVQDSERRGHDDEEITREHTSGVVSHECAPRLRARRGPWARRHVPPHGPRRHPDPKLHQQFVGNAFLAPSRPGEFHPEPLTDPCLTVSGHTARAIQGELPPSVAISRFLPSPVDQVDHNTNGLPPSLRGRYPLHRYYGAVRPCPAHQYFRPRGSTACTFSL